MPATNIKTALVCLAGITPFEMKFDFIVDDLCVKFFYFDHAIYAHIKRLSGPNESICIFGTTFPRIFERIRTRVNGPHSTIESFGKFVERRDRIRCGLNCDVDKYIYEEKVRAFLMGLGCRNPSVDINISEMMAVYTDDQIADIFTLA